MRLSLSLSHRTDRVYALIHLCRNKSSGGGRDGNAGGRNSRRLTTRLLLSAFAAHGSWDLAQRASAQAADLHNALKAACPKYAAECLQPTVPLIPGAPENTEAAAATPAKEEKGGKGKGKGKDAGGGAAAAAAVAPIGPGTVVVVWHEQDGCWQHNDSWFGEGELGAGPSRACRLAACAERVKFFDQMKNYCPSTRASLPVCRLPP